MSKARAGTGEDNPFTDIDTLIHEPARLNTAQLYVLESADFLFLMRQTGLTFGNLSSHISKLEAAGYVNVKEEFLGKRPHTMLRLSGNGPVAFRKYMLKLATHNTL